MSVFEPDPTNNNSLTLQTSYTYTVLNQVAGVSQGSQTRTFNFDDAGRMSSQVIPEGGSTSFQYNNFDKMTQRTDNRGVITTYTYDTLNRLHYISYNVGSTGVPATPSVEYNYGTDPSKYNNGKLLTVTDAAGSETYSYDLLGRTTQVQEVISGNTYTIGYQYNLAGEVTTLTYPSTRAVTAGYDAIGRLTSVATGSTNYASGVSYDAANHVTGFNFGNGVAVTYGYSPDMMQKTSIAYAKGGTNLFSQNYSYAENGGNDGEVTSVTDNVDSGRSMTYVYDGLHRLASAVSQGSTNYPKWGLSFTYDRYGNRTAQTVTAGSGPSNSLSVNAGTNQISTAGYSYDANGNMTNDYQNAIEYDGENRLVSDADGSGTANYVYQASGHRVVKTLGGNTTVYIFNGNQLIAEYVNATLSKEYIYLGSRLVTSVAGNVTLYFLPDRTSNRVLSDINGNIEGQQGTYPFGEVWYTSGASTEFVFTSYQRDAESNNDYAMAREYVNRLARFSALDTGQWKSTDPQQFDRYSYVANDPINRIDPTGQFDLLGCDPDFEDCGCDEFLDPTCGFGGGGGGGFGFGLGGPALECALCHQACNLKLAFNIGLCSFACALGQTFSCVRCILIANQGCNACQMDCDQKWYCNV